MGESYELYMDGIGYNPRCSVRGKSVISEGIPSSCAPEVPIRTNVFPRDGCLSARRRS